MYEDFTADRIAKLRVKKGVSARDMSLSIGQSENYINKIENKHSLPSLQGLFYICEYLGITPKEFFDDEAENPVRLNEILADIGRLDDTALAHLHGVIKEMLGKSRD